MEIKAKYHYSYFLNPFVIDEKKYVDFLEKIVNDKKWKLRIFDKVEDMETYTHFLVQAKEIMFPSFYWSDKYKLKLEQMTGKKCAKELAKASCVEFTYDLNDEFQMQGKVEDTNQIFFEISEMKLICFNSGISFLIFKTNIVTEDESVSFRQLLNFNYKFKEISSEYAKYKSTDNIYIQTSQFENMQSVSDFIKSITQGYVALSNDDIYSDRMFVYSYACIDERDWNCDTNFEKIQDNLFKYIFQFPGDYNSDINLSKEEYDEAVYSKWKYSRYGFTKLGGVVFTSATDHFNYTKLPVDYEKVSMYIMILAFYKRIALLTLNNQLTNAGINEVKKIEHRISLELNSIRFSQISNSSHGMSLWKSWNKAFEIEKLYDELDKIYMRWLEKIKGRRMNMFFAFVSFILTLIFAINVLRIL